MIIRPYHSGDLIHIKSIVKKLHPQWFDENALKNIPIDIQLGKTYVAEKNSEIKGTYDKTQQFYLKNGFKLIEKKEQQKFKEFTYRRGVLLKML